MLWFFGWFFGWLGLGWLIHFLPQYNTHTYIYIMYILYVPKEKEVETEAKRGWGKYIFLGLAENPSERRRKEGE